MTDERFVLKVWSDERCYGKIGNIDSKATLALEDAVYQRLGSRPHILKYHGKVLIGDFGGSKIDDQEPLAGEETRYQLPHRGRDWESVDDAKKEIFALGCGIYEIMAWKAPFSEMTDEQVIENCANEEFPDTNGLLVGNIIHACWNEKFEAAADVEIALREKLVDTWEERTFF
ncbi:hypothetical protein DL95DRAFT_440168 [Leptodontidium sp. 2 PMI_412]|nr:hypothetical protein DL95DRAFT_440168 [Leptodontidium sp. 2 PMI_412]